MKRSRSVGLWDCDRRSECSYSGLGVRPIVALNAHNGHCRASRRQRPPIHLLRAFSVLLATLCCLSPEAVCLPTVGARRGGEWAYALELISASHHMDSRAAWKYLD